jgi:NDP-sugar pyrophosphorylase family protein
LIERAVILAIGNPVHRSQIAINRPRSMLPALGKPLVVRAMNRLLPLGIRHFVVIVGENEGAVAAYLNKNWVPNVKVEFILKSSNDSLIQVLARIARKDNQPFLIASYHAFTHPRFPDTLLKNFNDSPDALILSGAQTTLSKAQQGYFAALEGQKVTGIVTQKPEGKSHSLLAHLAICGNAFVNYLTIPQGTGSFHKQLMDIFQMYIETDGAALAVESAWILQIEADYDLLTLSKHLLEEGQDAHILSELPYTVQIVPPVRIDPQVSVGQGARIGPFAYLERGCSVGREAVVQNALILQQANVPAKASISDAIWTAQGPIPL